MLVSNVFTRLFTNLFFGVNTFLPILPSLGHRTLGLSRERQLARGGQGVETVPRGTLSAPDLPLDKPCGSTPTRLRPGPSPGPSGPGRWATCGGLRRIRCFGGYPCTCSHGLLRATKFWYASRAMPSPERTPIPDAELSQPAVVLAQRFVQRWDTYSQQLDDGRYKCVHGLLGVDHLFAHLRGEITLGAYLLDEHSRARLLVLDADDDTSWRRLGRLARALADEDVTAYLEGSRRGGHLWLFLAQQTEAQYVREFGAGLLAAHGVEGVELFPKQDRLARGPGSLVRMPFGVHRLTGRRYGFYRSDGAPLAPSVREQLLVLRTPETVQEAVFEAYRSRGPSLPLADPTEPVEEVEGTLSARIKASVSVLDFVGRYADLNPTSTGAIGLCPFHDDHRPSLSINAEGNYWHCFAGCGGGSVIDFWMRWRECDFSVALGELAGTLL